MTVLQTIVDPITQNGSNTFGTTGVPKKNKWCSESERDADLNRKRGVLRCRLPLPRTPMKNKAGRQSCARALARPKEESWYHKVGPLR
jgi:hypothetical protein